MPEKKMAGFGQTLQSESVSRRTVLKGAGATASILAMPGIVRAQTKGSIVITTAGVSPMHITPHVGVRRGIFAKHGLEASVDPAQTITEPIPLMLSNRVHFGVTSPGMAVNSTAAGGAIKIVANTVAAVPIWGMTREGEPITELTQLKGKTLATHRFPSSSVVIPTYAMREIGKMDLDADNVTILELPGGQPQAVLDNRADFAPMFEWFGTLALRQTPGLEIGLSFKDIIGPMAYASSMCTADYAAANPEIVQAYCDAIAETQQLMISDPSAFIEAASAQHPDIDIEVVELTRERFFTGVGVFASSPTITPEDYEKDMQIELLGGAVKEILPYDQMVDNSFAVNAAEKFG